MTTTRLFTLLLTVLPLCAEIITADRRVTWQGNVGIPGGIPNRTTVFTTLSSIDNTGAVNVTTPIQNAINACPSNQVVVLPAGFFRIGTLSMKEGVTLRGQGMTNTVLQHFAIEAIRFSADAAFEVDKTVNSGYTHGSTSITLGDASSIAVGMICLLDQNNNTNMGVNMVGSEGGPLFGPPPGTPHPTERLYNRAAGHYVEVTAKVGNTLTVTPPLAYNFTAASVPKLRAEVISGTQTHIRMASLESLTVTNVSTFNAGDLGFTILMRRAAFCWLKNVETRKSHRRAVLIRWGFRNQVEGCSIRQTIRADSDMGYGITTDFWSTANLFQNNIADAMLNCVALEGGSCMNVAAYNFYTNGVFRTDGSAPDWMPGGFSAHAGHYGFNLFEGNVGDQSVADMIHGSGSHHTWMRNHFRGQRTDKTSNERCLQAHSWNRFHNVVGNVLGNSLWQPSHNYESYPPSVIVGSSAPCVYWLGWWGVSQVSSSTADTATRHTMIRHGNWDAVTQAVNWEPSISDHTIPTSYVYASRPSYWGVNWPWPSIGSDLNPRLGTIPAQRRYLGIDEGSGPGQPPTTFTISVRSLNPGTLVQIGATTDNDGFGAGLTIFTRTYNDGASVTLTAPATANGQPFTKWQRDGVDWAVTQATTFSATAAFTFTAIYGTPTLPSQYLTLQGLTFLPP